MLLLWSRNAASHHLRNFVQVVTMLLSEDQPITDVPVSDYDYHSGGIIETLEGLLNTSPHYHAWKEAK